MTEFNRFLAEIIDGRHDKQLTALAEALGERLNADNVDGRWVCKLPDEESFTVKDLTYRAKRLFESASKKNLNAVELTGLSATDEANLVAAYWAIQDPEREGCFTRAMERVEDLPGDGIVFDIEIVAAADKDGNPLPLDDSGA